MTRTAFNVLSIVLLALLVAPVSRAADKPDGKDSTKNDPEMVELRKRFESRYADIRALKSKGLIGETFEGYIDYVKDKDETVAELVDDENSDRTKLYELIAKHEDTSVKKVAERNARRNFEKAAPGEYLRGADGEWHKKKE